MKRLSGATALALAMAALGLAACHGDDDNNGSQTNSLPSFISGSVRTQTYDGSSDDLLTAGLGKTGLASATPPGIANAAAPKLPNRHRNSRLVRTMAGSSLTCAAG